ncbi:putative SOS response-associated peptidase YedK [Rhizobium ruizarguesonis]|jgi:putative SOS response-associated peptidase YedK
MTEKEAQGQIALLRNRYLARNAVVGQAFTMLTMEPRPDIAQYHDRQVVILGAMRRADWLDPTISAKSLLKPPS